MNTENTIWYNVSLLFKANIEEKSDYQGNWDEQIVLVRAYGEQEAIEKSKLRGKD